MNLMMRDYSEKRDYIRMKVDAQIELRTFHPERVLRGICKDLSGTGMAIEVEDAFQPGTELSTCLPSNNESFPPFETIVRVIRCTATANGRFLLGVEIIRVDG